MTEGKIKSRISVGYIMNLEMEQEFSLNLGFFRPPISKQIIPGFGSKIIRSGNLSRSLDREWDQSEIFS